MDLNEKPEQSVSDETKSGFYGSLQNVNPEAGQEENKSEYRHQKIFLRFFLILIFLAISIIVVTIVYRYFFAPQKSIELPETKSITVDLPGEDMGEISFDVPNLWISDPFYPENKGFPIALFPSQLEIDKADQDEFVPAVFQNFRMISGFILPTNPLTKSTLDKEIDMYKTGNKYYTQEITPKENSENISYYKCLEFEQDNSKSARCFIFLQSEKYFAQNTLYSNLENFDADLKVFLNTIESLTYDKQE